MIRVLLADDDVLVRSGLRALLDAEEDITVVGEAADGREAVERARGLQPDVVLMDVRMPRLDGVSATREIASWPRRPRVLVLTTFDLDEVVDDALDAGADGFLLKRATPEQLIDGIRTVVAGDALVAPAVTWRLLAACRPAALTATSSGWPRTSPSVRPTSCVRWPTVSPTPRSPARSGSRRRR